MRFYLMLAGINIYWGITQVLIKHALLYMSSSTYTALRFGTVAVLMLALLFARRSVPSRETVVHGVILGSMVAGQTLLNSASLYFTSTANSVFIAQLSIVAVPAYYMLRERKPPTRDYLIAVVLMLAGLCMFADVMHGALNIGDAIVVLSMLTICVQIIYGARVTAHDDLFQLAAVQMITAGVVSCAVAAPQGFEVAWNPTSVGIIVLTGVVGSGVCNSLRLVAQKHVEPTAVSFINILHPVFAMVGAAVIPNELGQVEPILWFKVLGSIVMIAGMTYYLAKSSKIALRAAPQISDGMPGSAMGK